MPGPYVAIGLPPWRVDYTSSPGCRPASWRRRRAWAFQVSRPTWPLSCCIARIVQVIATLRRRRSRPWPRPLDISGRRHQTKTERLKIVFAWFLPHVRACESMCAHIWPRPRPQPGNICASRTYVGHMCAWLAITWGRRILWPAHMCGHHICGPAHMRSWYI